MKYTMVSLLMVALAGSVAAEGTLRVGRQLTDLEDDGTLCKDATTRYCAKTGSADKPWYQRRNWSKTNCLKYQAQLVPMPECDVAMQKTKYCVKGNAEGRPWYHVANWEKQWVERNPEKAALIVEDSICEVKLEKSKRCVNTGSDEDPWYTYKNWDDQTAELAENAANIVPMEKCKEVFSNKEKYCINRYGDKEGKTPWYQYANWHSQEANDPRNAKKRLDVDGTPLTLEKCSEYLKKEKYCTTYTPRNQDIQPTPSYRVVSWDKQTAAVKADEIVDDFSVCTAKTEYCAEYAQQGESFYKRKQWTLPEYSHKDNYARVEHMGECEAQEARIAAEKSAALKLQQDKQAAADVEKNELRKNDLEKQALRKEIIATKDIVAAEAFVKSETEYLAKAEEALEKGEEIFEDGQTEKWEFDLLKQAVSRAEKNVNHAARIYKRVETALKRAAESEARKAEKARQRAFGRNEGLRGNTATDKKNNKNKNRGDRRKDSFPDIEGACFDDHVCASVKGDPHITTFDGLKFDCQGHGEFVLARSLESSFEVQGRFQDARSNKNGRMITITKGISIDAGVEGVPSVDIIAEEGEGPKACILNYFIDGKPAQWGPDGKHPITETGAQIDGIELHAKGNKDLLYFPDAGISYSVLVRYGNFGCVMMNDLCIPPKLAQEETIVGLFGSPNRNKMDDWMNKEDKNLFHQNSVKGARAYEYCTENWCVSQEESIFGYLPDEEWSDFYGCDRQYSQDNTENLIEEATPECEACCGDIRDAATSNACLLECVEGGVIDCQAFKDTVTVFDASRCDANAPVATKSAIDDTPVKTLPPPPPAPPAPITPRFCDAMFEDMKCKSGASRLIDNRNTNLHDCRKACEDNELCEFYSYADEGEFEGVCMGCGAESDAQQHVGFDFYPVDCAAEKSEKEPEPLVFEGQCKDMRVNVKCPHKDPNGDPHKDRLYRLEDQTLESCRQKCLDTEGCDYYSFAEAGTYANVCMGCITDVEKQEHVGFNLYSKDCIGDREVTSKSATPDVLTKTDLTTPNTFVKGDPHFKTFGGEMYDYHGECDLVLLHNPQFHDNLGMDIHIRTKIEDFWSSVESAAVKIGDEAVEIHANPDSNEWLWINGEAVTSDKEVGKWHRSSVSGLLIRYKSSGKNREANIYLEGDKEPVILRTFKNFVHVDIDWVNSSNYEGSTGLLGSHADDGKRLGRDGSFIADLNEFGQEWQVNASEPQLFHSYEGAVVLPNKCVLPPTADAKVALRKRRLASGMDMAVAEKACAHLTSEADKKACVFDVIATQDTDMASVW